MQSVSGCYSRTRAPPPRPQAAAAGGRCPLPVPFPRPCPPRRGSRNTTAAPAGETAAVELRGSGSPLGHGRGGPRRRKGGPCGERVSGRWDSGGRCRPVPGRRSAAAPGQLRRSATGPGWAGGGGGGEGGSRCRHRGSRLARLVAAAAPAPLPPPRLPPPSFPFSRSLRESTVPPFPDGSRQRHAASRSSSSSPSSSALS